MDKIYINYNAGSIPPEVEAWEINKRGVEEPEQVSIERADGSIYALCFRPDGGVHVEVSQHVFNEETCDDLLPQFKVEVCEGAPAPKEQEDCQTVSFKVWAMMLAHTTARKSKDPWRKVGCVLLRKEDNTAVMGYNGFPKGMPEDWTNREERRKFAVHAEQNALRYVRPGECYFAAVTTLPCNDCLKALAAYGITEVAYGQTYEHDCSSMDLAKDFGITLTKINVQE
jgi:dCMP deaminase